MAARLALLALCLGVAGAAQAQLGKATQEELSRNGNGPGPVPGGVSAATLIKVQDTLPPADARDFSGTWRIVRAAGVSAAAAASAGTAPAASADSAPPASADSAPPAQLDAPASGAPGQLPNGILCLPIAGTSVGVDGPLLLLQSPTMIYWVAEQGHLVRRIYIGGQHQTASAPNYLGDALAHYEGDTLVIETVGLRRLPPGGRMIEHWAKSADRKQIDMTIDDVDANGAAIGVTRRQSISWRPGEQVMEWMCEDYNDEWLPGGSEFHDQVGR
jgi:hypothetical protein